MRCGCGFPKNDSMLQLTEVASLFTRMKQNKTMCKTVAFTEWNKLSCDGKECMARRAVVSGRFFLVVESTVLRVFETDKEFRILDEVSLQDACALNVL